MLPTTNEVPFITRSTSTSPVSGPVPAALRLPADTYPAGDEGGHRCDDQSIQEEQTCQECVLGPFVAMAGLVLTRVVDPVTDQRIGGMIMGIL